MSKLNYPLLALASVACAGLTGIVYEAYNRSAKLYKALSSPEPSKFELAASKLGFSTTDQQEALLTIFYLAGYFKSEKLWQDLVNFNKRENPTDIFASIERVVAKAGANQDDHSKFDAKILRKGLFANVEIYDIQDIEDWLLYVAQNAFDRKVGVERYELTDTDWMVNHQGEDIEQARKLGLIDEIASASEKYYQIWITGASHDTLLARINYYHKHKYLSDGGVLVLAGQRPLWGEIDGEKYIKTLAESKNIKLKQGKPFIKYGQKSEDNEKSNPEIEYKDIIDNKDLPEGYTTGRSYPNYANQEGGRLTESLMAEHLLESQWGVRTRSQKVNTNGAKVIDTKLVETGDRPNTANTAHDASACLIEKIQEQKNRGSEQKDFHVLFVSNNPYIERQKIVTQREVDASLANSGLKQEGYSIKIEEVGPESTATISVVHSELAALVAEKYRNSHPEVVVEEAHRHHLSELLFQDRGYYEPEDELPIPPCKEYLIGKCQDVFEYCYWH